MENVKEMTATEIANVNDTAKAIQKKLSASKRKSIPAVWRVVNKARSTFEAQLTKNNEVKLASIEHYIASVFNDADKFWIDFMNEVNRLVDSKKYEWECHTLKIDSGVLATHIVFLGSATINKVLKYGVLPTLGTDYKLYDEGFISEDAEPYFVDYSKMSDKPAESEPSKLSQPKPKKEVGAEMQKTA